MDFSVVDQAPFNILVKAVFLIITAGFIAGRISHAADDFARTGGDWKSILDEGIQIILGLIVGIGLMVMPASFLLTLGYGIIKFLWNTVLVPLLGIIGISLQPLP